MPAVTHLFLDIGGVLLTNGWDRAMRKEAANRFKLDYAEMDERHHLTFDTYEQGKLSLDQYLDRTVFYESRSFTREQFRDFMLSQSRPYPDMVDYVRELKARHGLKVATISNEGRELTVYRIRRFELYKVVDFFVSSCFVHFRKPDEDIWRVALDISLAEPDQVVYVDDRPLFAEVARGLGMKAVHHTGLESTKAALARFGLP
ncbi:MAG: HAD-IA family hydrolase [Syntrophorhabdales bacterium]|jgi:putative hydrolase of the HAD superfamily